MFGLRTQEVSNLNQNLLLSFWDLFTRVQIEFSTPGKRAGRPLGTTKESYIAKDPSNFIHVGSGQPESSQKYDRYRQKWLKLVISATRRLYGRGLRIMPNPTAA
jgi:hypothetical protein